MALQRLPERQRSEPPTEGREVGEWATSAGNGSGRPRNRQPCSQVSRCKDGLYQTKKNLELGTCAPQSVIPLCHLSQIHNQYKQSQIHHTKIQPTHMVCPLSICSSAPSCSRLNCPSAAACPRFAQSGSRNDSISKSVLLQSERSTITEPGQLSGRKSCLPPAVEKLTQGTPRSQSRAAAHWQRA